MQELKEVLMFGLSLQKAYALAKADGKVDLADMGYLIDPISKLMPAVDNIVAVKDELKSMSAEDRASLMAEVAVEFDIADDVLEAKIEGGLDLVLHIAQYLGVVGAFVEPAEPV